MASDMTMPSAEVVSAPYSNMAQSEYGTLLGFEARTQWQPPAGQQRTAQSQNRMKIPWRMRCSRACGRLMTIGCGTHVCGVRVKLDMWHLPQVLLIIYVASLVWSALGLPIPSLHNS
jgi:hypothetical protein